MAALITLCNQALAQIAAGSIADLDEGSIESKECKRFAQPLLEEMADWSDSITLGRTRVVLASVANDRPAEWLYAYAKPSDLGAAIAIRAVQDDAEYLPQGGPYTFPYQDAEPLAHAVEGGVIYTNVPTATLIYSKSTITASDLPPLGQRAFVTELAARIALPIKKDPKLAAAVSDMASRDRLRYMADEENKTPRGTTRYISEVEYARSGLSV